MTAMYKARSLHKGCGAKGPRKAGHRTRGVMVTSVDRPEPCARCLRTIREGERFTRNIHDEEEHADCGEWKAVTGT
jgi:hypothetical protein